MFNYHALCRHNVGISYILIKKIVNYSLPAVVLIFRQTTALYVTNISFPFFSPHQNYIDRRKTQYPSALCYSIFLNFGLSK